jgi:hypothetical protein
LSSNIAIIGASLGGLVAAAELRSLGHKVTIVEKGKSVGGLYNKIQTPFGVQELGMHVIYASHKHFLHLCAIFGEEVFHTLEGYKVDIGASANFSDVYFQSHYPNLLNHPLREVILGEIIANTSLAIASNNAMEEATRRFGPTAAKTIIAPILKKLWHQDAKTLSSHALHCFFDLRRLVVCNKVKADELKNRPELNDVIANPIQSLPKGLVFDGRLGLTFRPEFNDLADRVSSWAAQERITLLFGQDVDCIEGKLSIEGREVSKDFDACIVAAPIHLLADISSIKPDCLELSIAYFQLLEQASKSFPSYYMLVHDAIFKASRIVNYDAYNPDCLLDRPSVIAIETVHKAGCAPTEAELIQELSQIAPSLHVTQSYKLDRSISVFAPTLHNARLLNDLQGEITRKFEGKPIYFSGMRTDTGIFFSHHTIGLAYDSALACHKRLTSN